MASVVLAAAMAGVVEVHDKMIAHLQQRNVQLQREKADVELRLRQMTSLLSELQSLWMDLPPKVAETLNKVLTGQNGRSQSATDQKSDASKAKTSSWLSLPDFDAMFGCSSSTRNDEEAKAVKRRPDRKSVV